MHEPILRALIRRALEEGRDQDARELAKHLPPVSGEISWVEPPEAMK